MARALLAAIASPEIIDLRPTGLTLVELLDALVTTRLRLAQDPHAIAAEALAETPPSVPPAAPLLTTS
jgi:hypothetical protein